MRRRRVASTLKSRGDSPRVKDSWVLVGVCERFRRISCASDLSRVTEISHVARFLSPKFRRGTTVSFELAVLTGSERQFRLLPIKEERNGLAFTRLFVTRCVQLLILSRAICFAFDASKNQQTNPTISQRMSKRVEIGKFTRTTGIAD